MTSVAEAQTKILAHCRALDSVFIPLSSECLESVLAEDISCDRDMPPFAKSLMDGYALRFEDLTGSETTFAVVEEITAGHTPAKPVGTGQASRIMTGAPIPSGADTVVVVERTQLGDDGRVRANDPHVAKGQNILARAAEMREGEWILRAGDVIRPQEMGMLAAVGRTKAAVVPRPAVAIVPTGDEIVEVDQKPGPSQIRNSNGPMLAGQVQRAGGVPHTLGIGHDNPDQLRALIQKGLKFPVLLLSGGVSAGKMDLVPGILQDLGVRPHFHKIEMKPGKPLFFGTLDNTLVFGLPGNPVSSLVCFELFVRPAIRKLRGLKIPGPFLVNALLTEDFSYHSDRPTYYPAWLSVEESGNMVKAVPWFGSSDLRGLTKANAFIVLPKGDSSFQAGAPVTVLMVENV